MRSIIICEGGTDLTLIQYFMETVNGWMYNKGNKKLGSFKLVKNFINNNNNTLLIQCNSTCMNGCLQSIRWLTELFSR